MEIGKGAGVGGEQRGHHVGESGAQVGDRDLAALEGVGAFDDQAVVEIFRGEAALFAARHWVKRSMSAPIRLSVSV